jgi:hypothetical protein
MFSAGFLLASLLWGSIGVGYFVYGKKQQSLSPMVKGILMRVRFLSSAPTSRLPNRIKLAEHFHN